MPSDSLAESEECHSEEVEMEEVKTKTEFLRVPDKVTHGTMDRTKNRAVGNCDPAPSCC